MQILSTKIYDRLRSASRLESAPTPQIRIHQRHYLKLWSNLRYSQIGVLSIFSDLWPIDWLGLQYTSVKILDGNLRKWETAIDLRIGYGFENLKKKPIDLRILQEDMDLRIGHRIEAGRRSESHILIKVVDLGYPKIFPLFNFF